MTFEDLEKKFRDSRPSASDLEPTEKSLEVWDAIVEISIEKKKTLQPQKVFSLVASIVFLVVLSAVLLATHDEKKSMTVQTFATTTSTTQLLPTPLSGWNYGTARTALEHEVQRINNLKKCLTTSNYEALLVAFLAKTRFSEWQIFTDTEVQANRCAIGKVSTEIQAIKISLR